MNLKELIESNKNKFKKSIKVEEVDENSYKFYFSNNFNLEFCIYPNGQIIYFTIRQEEEKWQNLFKKYDDYNFNKSNDWLYSIHSICNQKYIDKNCSLLILQEKIINLINIIEQWSLDIIRK